MMIYPYLQDSEFLKMFDRIKLKEQYVNITVLSFDEKPIQSIQGIVVSGSISINGDSSMRRTANLNILLNEEETDLSSTKYLFSINKKMQIEIGYKNTTDLYTEYSVIWFPCGIYVVNNSSISKSSSGLNVSLQLKDKMCLLNGECGGTIPASTTFDEYETVNENGDYVLLRPTIYQIVQELVNHFGGEQLSKIIISDLSTRVKQVMKWCGNSPLFIIIQPAEGTIQYTATTNEKEAIAAGSYQAYGYGEDIGYIYTDFTYPGELVGNAGSTVTSILDQIVSVLGNYEYFYDVYGNFIFQEKKNYLNTSHSTIELDKLKKEDYLIDMNKGKAVYTFDDSLLITSYNNNPQYNMIKNDFIVWGVRKTASGNEIPIRYHLAIDQKPQLGDTYEVFFYEDPNDKITKAKCPIKYNSTNDFPRVGTEEVFYMDISTSLIYEWNSTTKKYQTIDVHLTDVTASDWRTELYLAGSVAEPLGRDSNYYYTELKNEWPKIYDVQNGTFLDDAKNFQSEIDFFLDFIDTNTALSELSVNNIGRRSKVIVDNKINCVFEPEIPDLVLLDLGAENIAELRQECEDQGQDYIQMESSIYALIVSGGTHNSAYNAVRELLYEYTSYNESISLSTIPILYLEPNTRITVRDPESGIQGDYMINNISISFDITSTMSLSCKRALERI